MSAPATLWNPQNYTGSLPTRPILRDAGANMLPGIQAEIGNFNSLMPLLGPLIMQMIQSMSQANMQANARRSGTSAEAGARRRAKAVGVNNPNLGRDMEFEAGNVGNEAYGRSLVAANSPESRMRMAMGGAQLLNPANLLRGTAFMTDLNSAISSSNSQRAPSSGGLGGILGQVAGMALGNIPGLSQILGGSQSGGSSGSSSGILPPPVSARLY